jgi:hypothetical protein
MLRVTIPILAAISIGLAPMIRGADDNRAGMDWWSLRPVQRPDIPWKSLPNDSVFTGWVRSPVDAFILERIHGERLEPSPAADPAILIRRATFDIVGLPPTPDEIASFLSDQSADAYERLIDRLLASPHYGERWARHWLDVARFAESQGFERDIIRDHAWRYRDYVIGSLNQDRPYDEFVRQQIAGDAMDPVEPEGIIATGFLIAGPYDEAGSGSKSALLRARIREEELEDIIGTTGQAFLGLTVHCARCHDHKFDPIPQRDYYRFKAVFDGVRHGNRPAIPPSEESARQAEADRIAQSMQRIETQIADIERPARRELLNAARAGSRSESAAPQPIARWSFESDARDEIGELHGTLRGGATIRNGRLHLDGKRAFAETTPLNRDLKAKTLEVWASLTNQAQQGGGLLSVETLGGGVFDAIVFGEREPKKWIAGSEGFIRTMDLTAAVETETDGQLIQLAVSYDMDNQIRVYRNGLPYGDAYLPAGPNSTLRTFSSEAAHILFGLRHTGAGNGFFDGQIEEARLYDRALSPAEITASFQLKIPTVSDEQLIAALSDEQLASHAALVAELDALRNRKQAIASIPQVYAANSRAPGPTHILLRGDVEKKGDQVIAGGLSCALPANGEFELAAASPESQRRLKFAQWVTHPANPLTARVIVNRIWHYHFGRGIVGTPSDFGWNGERPSHPDLLDWLASELVASGWSIKHLHRLIMLSSTYRQSSRYDPQAAAIDADNRLLWRFPPRRLEGETVRDAMLSVSGELNREMMGPSFRPFKLEVFNSHFYHLNDPVGQPYNRRTIYRIHVNSAKDPLLDSMDCPDPSTKTPKRSITTTPIQALGLMNNSFVLRQADSFAKRLNESASHAAARIELAYQLAFAREPSDDETARALELVADSGLAAFCWALFNSSEFQYLR